MDANHPKIQQPWPPILDPSVPPHCLIPWGTLQSNMWCKDLSPKLICTEVCFCCPYATKVVDRYAPLCVIG